jgi:hypothetical protein
VHFKPKSHIALHHPQLVSLNQFNSLNLRVVLHNFLNLNERRFIVNSRTVGRIWEQNSTRGCIKVKVIRKEKDTLDTVGFQN